MHTLLIILICILGLIALFLGVVAFVVLQAFFAIQPILAQLGKISMVIEGVRFVKARLRRHWQRRHPEE